MMKPRRSILTFKEILPLCLSLLVLPSALADDKAKERREAAR